MVIRVTHNAHNILSLLIPVVCQAKINEYEVLAFPTNLRWMGDVAQKYGERWNFHTLVEEPQQ